MKKNRRDFIKATGLLGAASFLPLNNPLSMLNKADNFGDCVLIPSETAGPFPLDLTDNTYYFRQDVREDRTG
ncbi:MAG TPA: twin-arginine translocation signal domain-containing protein, partial [Saprospiraceae bacterium]|nr:twin-arginine translocation signal domain-containing protein [Saprospiraceae bacterium]